MTQRRLTGRGYKPYLILRAYYYHSIEDFHIYIILAGSRNRFFNWALPLWEPRNGQVLKTSLARSRGKEQAL